MLSPVKPQLKPGWVNGPPITSPCLRAPVLVLDALPKAASSPDERSEIRGRNMTVIPPRVSLRSCGRPVPERILEDPVRFHRGWGSWHRPHEGDVPLKDSVAFISSSFDLPYGVR